jgi:hypothetical protein
MIEANSFEHLPRLHRERLDKWDHCYWNFEPLATEADAEVKP